MTFKEWLEEARRIYQNEPPEDFAPLANDDVWRVFHGFAKFSEAVKVAKFGLSGKIKADRNFSYENNNNPYGLFVTVDLKQAKKFAYSSPRAIMEFHANIKDLEAPVWPNGRYTVQGEKEGRFNSRYDRHQARLKAHIDAAYYEPPYSELDKRLHPEDYKAVMNMKRSYYPALARTMQAGEKQGLYVGNLNPNMIKRFWVAEGNIYAKYVPMTHQEFLKKYGGLGNKEDEHEYRHKMFKPFDEFDLRKLLDGMKKQFQYKDDEEAIRTLGWLWDSHIKQTGENLNHLVWPKQLPGLVKYCHRIFGGSPRSQRKKRK